MTDKWQVKLKVNAFCKRVWWTVKRHYNVRVTRGS